MIADDLPPELQEMLEKRSHNDRRRDERRVSEDSSIEDERRKSTDRRMTARRKADPEQVPTDAVILRDEVCAKCGLSLQSSEAAGLGCPNCV